MAEIIIPEPERFGSEAYVSVLEETDSALVCTFKANALHTMQDIAQAGYPDEICGLLIGLNRGQGWEVSEVRQVENINKERAADRFQLDPAGYQAIDSELRGSGNEIIGVFHSHPDCPARPSPTDLSNAWEGFVYPIVSVCKGQVAEVNCWIVTDEVSCGGRFQRLPHQA